ncbi:MAG: hypothetical protein ACLFR0_08860 [Alphaproteobacteria bacterium]
MQVHVKELLNDIGIDEPFYPGKRLVKSLRQPGEFKSHCVVFDWRNPDKIRIEIKAGLSGRDLVVEKLKQYPVCFQSPTFFEIEVNGDQVEKEDEEGKGKAGSSSGGGKGQKKKKLSELNGLMSQAFADMSEGKVPELGTMKEMVVMGMEIASEAFEAVFDKLKNQITHGKIAATELLAQAGKFITKYTPPSFMKPSGNEDAVYKYDRSKNENIGMRGPAM